MTGRITWSRKASHPSVPSHACSSGPCPTTPTVNVRTPKRLSKSRTSAVPLLLPLNAVVK